jgi:hypothetical protein
MEKESKDDSPDRNREEVIGASENSRSKEILNHFVYMILVN